MSVTKIRPSGLFAIKRTRFNPSAATLMPNACGRLSVNDPALLPLVSVMRLGESFRAGELACVGTLAGVATSALNPMIENRIRLSIVRSQESGVGSQKLVVSSQ